MARGRRGAGAGTEPRSVAKERFWRQALLRQRRSGLSVRGFCRREGFSEPSFYWWRRELAHRDTFSASSRRSDTSVSVAHGRTARSRPAAGRRQAPPPRFAPVMVTPTLWPATNSAAYEVQFSGGVRVLVHAAASEKLQDVLAALRPILSSASAGAAES